MFSVALSVIPQLSEMPQPFANKGLGILPCGVWTFLPPTQTSGSGHPPFQSQTT